MSSRHNSYAILPRNGPYHLKYFTSQSINTSKIGSNNSNVMQQSNCCPTLSINTPLKINHISWYRQYPELLCLIPNPKVKALYNLNGLVEQLVSQQSCNRSAFHEVADSISNCGTRSGVSIFDALLRILLDLWSSLCS